MKQCVFCQADHQSADCNVYLTYQARVDRTRNLGRCARCIHPGHVAANCHQQRIKCYGCNGKHFRYLCPNAPQIPEQPEVAAVECVVGDEKLSEPTVNWINVCSVGNNTRSPLINATGRALLLTLFVDICVKKTNLRVRVLIDPGADVCLVSRRLCEEAGLKLMASGERRLIVGEGASASNITHSADVPIGPPDGAEMGRLRACVVDIVTRPITHVIGKHTRRILAEHSIHVHDCLTTGEAADTPIELLIGMDALPNFCTDIRALLTQHLCARKTIVGWCVSGVESTGDSYVTSAVCMSVRSAEEEIDLSRLWIGEDLSVSEKIEASTVLEDVRKNISFQNHRYWIGLPWLREGVFDSNFASLLYCLRKLIERLQSTGQYFRYESELMQLVLDGHAERVSLSACGKSYYMPHRGVWKEQAFSSKLRIVFDTSSHRKDHDPLNARLCKGVDLNPSIVTLLIRFRIGTVAAVADLRKAFLQVRIHHVNRDFLRFL